MVEHYSNVLFAFITTLDCANNACLIKLIRFYLRTEYASQNSISLDIYISLFTINLKKQSQASDYSFFEDHLNIPYSFFKIYMKKTLCHTMYRLLNLCEAYDCKENRSIYSPLPFLVLQAEAKPSTDRVCQPQTCYLENSHHSSVLSTPEIILWIKPVVNR